MINSTIIKLAKLTVAAPCYRGVSGMRLPKSFFTKDEFGIAGGCEYGFMSTTSDRATAEQYAKVKNAELTFLLRRSSPSASFVFVTPS